MSAIYKTVATMRLRAIDQRDTPPIRQLFPLQLRSFLNLRVSDQRSCSTGGNNLAYFTQQKDLFILGYKVWDIVRVFRRRDMTL